MSDEKVFSSTEQTRTTHRPPTRGRKHIAVSGHALATHVAMRILDKGGNATDAGVAATLCLAVLQPDMVSFAGVAPMLIYDAHHSECSSITGLGWWPQAASTEYFQKYHKGELPPGILRTVVPGAPDACVQALQRYGSMSYAEVAAGALELALNGFPVHQFLANAIMEAERDYRRWPENAAIFLPDGKIPKVGDLFVQKDLAATMQAMIEAENTARNCGKNRVEALAAARDELYTGSVGRTIVTFHEDKGGLLTYNDMATFACDVEPPLAFEFGEYTILTHNAWSQGPVMPMALNILASCDLKSMSHNSAEYIHTVSEALKLAFADRERLFGDPRFIDVPVRGLLSPEYGKERYAMIRKGEAWTVMPPSGDPFAAEGRERPAHFEPLSDPSEPKLDEHALDTSYICVRDQWGSFFSATPSDMSFNTQIIPGTGLAISSRGTQSWINPRHPSSIQPRKRPRLTPTGCLVLRHGKPWLVFGTPGGDTQCQTNLQVFFNIILFGMDPQEAVEAPRFGVFCHPASFYPHAYSKGILRVESRVEQKTLDSLASWGHILQPWPDWAWKSGGSCIIVDERNVLTGGADPRRECCGMAW